MKYIPCCKLDFFGPNSIFNFLFVFFIVIPQVITLKLGWASLIDFWILVICLLGLLAYHLGTSHKYKFRFVADKNAKFMTCVAIIFLVIDFGAGFQNFLVKEAVEYRTSFMVANHNSIYKQLIFLVLLYIKFYAISVLIANSQKLFWIVFLVEFFCYIGSPVRLIALMPVIIFMTYGFYRSYIKMTFLRVILATCILPVVFVVLLLVRGMNGNNSFFRQLIDIITNLDLERLSQVLLVALESTMSYRYLKEIVTENFVSIESGILRNAFLVISRSIWPDKPESISRIVAKKYNSQQYNEGGGSVATIFGDGFINLHILGVFAICLIAGYGLKLVYNGIVSESDVRSQSIRIMLYAVSVHQFLFFFRGFMSETYWKFIILVLVFKTLNVLSLSMRKNDKI